MCSCLCVCVCVCVFVCVRVGGGGVSLRVDCVSLDLQPHTTPLFFIYRSAQHIHSADVFFCRKFFFCCDLAQVKSDFALFFSKKSRGWEMMGAWHGV